MAIYDYSCPSCGWSGTLYNIRISECDNQRCDQPLEKLLDILTDALCKETLVRSEDIPPSTFQMDASGNIGSAVLKNGQVVGGQFGGASGRRRRFKP